MNAHILLSGAALMQYNANFMELKKINQKKSLTASSQYVTLVSGFSSLVSSIA